MLKDPKTQKITWTTGEENKLTNEASARDVGTSWDASWGLNHCWEPFMWFSGTWLILDLAGIILVTKTPKHLMLFFSNS